MTDSITPPQWLTVPLENVILRIVGGGTPSKSKPEYYQGEIPWMSVKDMNKHALQDTADHISQAAVDNSSTNVIPAGTPIVATRMSLGKIVVADFDSAINQDLKALFLPSEIHRNYLVYWYRSVARQIEQMGTGTTVKGIRLEVLKGLEFALPPLAEQKVIADKLDTLLAQVENTKARLERTPQILKRFRQSVLAAAVSGRLTEEWRGKLAEHDEWRQVSLGDLIENGPQNGIYKPTNLYGSGCLIIRIDSFYDGIIADWSKLKRVQLDAPEIEKWHVNQGDILVNRVNSIEYLGKSALVNELTEPAVFESNIMRLSIKKDFAKPEFVSLFLRSPVGLERLRANAKLAVNQASINQNDVKGCLLILPTLSEQSEIVHRVDQLFAHADRIEQQVNNALARVNNLTQSILAKAFRGELTEQWRKDNPKLISGENSAEALLDRIKAERAATAKPKRRKAKT
ncbi:hypothetical protein C7H09_02695 [Marinobacter fuscus]|uniref:Type I restriction modification DNA specificity domain-containing protein n=1 Tax=Marinobacter fuscus TaxID=2109942 RepID=A0A2T1KTV6_9GAMM|nr:restriction endonuclease subunit S [Marinobacter fuscus]PSF13529.1 hypothetical protein C7H09_02695 [Marinobacter fuscus]